MAGLTSAWSWSTLICSVITEVLSSRNSPRVRPRNSSTLPSKVNATGSASIAKRHVARMMAMLPKAAADIQRRLRSTSAEALYLTIVTCGPEVKEKSPPETESLGIFYGFVAAYVDVIWASMSAGCGMPRAFALPGATGPNEPSEMERCP